MSNNKPEEQIHVDDTAPYTLHIMRPGKEDTTTQVARNMAKLQQALMVELEHDTLEQQELIMVSVSLPGRPVIGEGPTARLDMTREVDATLPQLSGTANKVMAVLDHEVVAPEQALLMLERFVNNLFTVSDLTAAIITVTSESKGVGGKTIINTKFKVADEDIVRLIEGADGHVATFKLAMQQQGMEFPTDTTIITPGSPGFTPQLRLVR
jgi:phage I-like protein